MPQQLPKYREHKPSGRAVIQWKPLFGDKRHYLKGKHGSPESKAEYAQIIAKIAEMLATGPAPVGRRRRIPNTLPLGRLCLDYKRHAERSMNGGGFSNLVLALNYVVEQFGLIQARDFGPASLESVRSEIERTAGWSRQHINAQVNKIRRMFRWAVSREFVESSVYAALLTLEPLAEGQTTAHESKHIEPVEWRHVERIFPFVTPIIADMIRLQCLTAMRSDELTAMNVSEIDFNDDVWVYWKRKHKTKRHKKKKFVCLGPQAQLILRKYLGEGVDFLFTPAQSVAEQAEARAKARKTPIYGRQKTRIVKFRKTAPRYFARSYQHSINYGFIKLAHSLGHSGKPAKGEPLSEWLAARGIVHWHPHQLRHSRSTETQNEYGLEGVRAQTGNSVQASQIYAHQSLVLGKRIARERG